MKDFFARLAGWFSDTRRAAVQALITSALTLLVVLGVSTAEQGAAVTDAAASGLLLVQGIIGLSLLRSSEWAVWFNTAGRAAIYAVATALGPIGLAFNIFGDETAAQIVSVATVLVSILTAFVQVVNTQTLNVDGPPIEPLTLDAETVRKIQEAHAARVLAERSAEANPATFKTERRPDWATPGVTTAPADEV